MIHHLVPVLAVLLAFWLGRSTRTRPKKETLTMAVATTDGNRVRVKARGVDIDGVTVAPADVTATIDQPELASVTPDPDNAGSWLVERLPTTDPAAGALTVSVTLTEAATGLSATLPIEFDPGNATSLVIDSEIVAPPPAA